MRAVRTVQKSHTGRGNGAGSKAAAVLVTAVAMVCFTVKMIPQITAQGENTALTAAGFIMPRGGAEMMKTGYHGDDAEDSGIVEPNSSNSSSGTSSIRPFYPGGYNLNSETDSQSSSSETPQSGLGKAYPINEIQMADNGSSYQNVFVKNTNQNHTINIAEELKKIPSVHIKTDGSPQVLIYHTHTTESYMSKELPFLYSSMPTRSQDNTQNVVMVGNAIEAELKAAGIGVIHDTTVHDYPSYNGSYYRSEDTMKKDLKKYPGIQVTLDIHRDAMGGDSARVKPTVVINGKKAAQLMIVSGCDDDGKQLFPNWEYNLRFALRLQKATADLFPGLARPIDFCTAQYNEYLTKGSLLVEVGTEVNTVEEASYSGSLFGKALVKTLKNLK